MFFFNFKNCFLNRIFNQKKNKIFKKICNFFIDLLMTDVGLTNSQDIYIFICVLRIRTTEIFLKTQAYLKNFSITQNDLY